MSAPPDTPALRSRAALPRWVIYAAGATALVLVVATVLLVATPRKSRPPRAARSDARATVTAEIVDLKQEPSVRAAALETLSKGTRLTILSDRGRWLEARAEKGERGFLPAESVETDSERRTREERAKRILSFTPVAGVVAEDTDVLLAPFPSAARAGHLSRGTPLPIYAVDHDYYAVRGDDGRIAFVHSSDVDLLPPDPRRPAIVPDSGGMIKNVSVINLAPSTEAPSPELAGESSGAGREGEAPSPEEPVEPAVLTSRVDPEYPEAARQAGVEGTVVLDATISETGRVTEIAVEKGLPMGVSEAAVAAVQRWKYRPAQGRTGPVSSHKTIRILFTLGG